MPGHRTFGALAMRQVSLALFALLALALLWVAWMRFDTGGRDVPGDASLEDATLPGEAVLVEDSAPHEREAVEVIEAPDLLGDVGYASELPVVEDSGVVDRFWGRLVAADSGAPVAGASVQFAHRQVVTSDTSGCFAYPLLPFSFTTLRARVDASGFATALFVLDEDHPTRDTALTIELERGGALAARVESAGGEAAPGIRVEVHPAEDDGQWNMQLDPDTFVGTDRLVLAAVTDSEGRAEVLGLAPGVVHRVDLFREGGPERALATPTEILRVAAGERREETFALPALEDVRGRMTYEDGKPAAGGLVWILAAKGSGGRYYDREEIPLDATHADGDGAFLFRDVPAGKWALGPGTPFDVRLSAIAMPLGEVEGFSIPPSPAAFADARVVVPDPARGEVLVRAYAGRILSGVVIAEESVTGKVVVFAEPLLDDGLLYTEVGPGGRFALAPLAPGNVRLRVVATGRGESALLGANVQPTDATDVRLTILRTSVGAPAAGRRLFQGAIHLPGEKLSFQTRIGNQGYVK